MNLSVEAVDQLRNALTLCKTLGIEGVALVDKRIMGMNDKRNLCIISDLDLGISQPVDVKLGIGRVSELDKRLGLFPMGVVITGKTTDKGDVSQLQLTAGRSKAHFRCSSISLMKYPKGNEDPALVVVTFKKEEVATVVKALRTFGAETLIIKTSVDGTVLIEFSDKTNDQFSTVLETGAEFVEDPVSALFTYSADNLATALDQAARDADEVCLVIGQAGTITTVVKGHTLVLLPNVDED